MRKSNVVEILARRLGATPSRIDAIAQRLADAGKLSRASGSRRYPPDLAEPEIVALFIAVIADNGLGSVRETVEQFAGMTNEKGQRLDLTLTTLLFGPPREFQHLIARQSPRIVTGNALMSIAAELQGATPEQADALTAMSRLQSAFN